MRHRILYLQFADPAAYPPIEHSSHLFAERGWEVWVLGVGIPGANTLRMQANCRLRVKKLPAVAPGWRQKSQYVFFGVRAIYMTLRLRPDWIYASDPLVCPIVWIIGQIAHVKLIYHEHDSPSEGGEQNHTVFMRSVLAFRAKVAQNADLCIIPQQARLRQVVKTVNRIKPTYCVWNCPRLREVHGPQKVENHCLTIYYHGTITPIRLTPELVIAASRLKGKVKIRIAGYESAGNHGYIKKLQMLAAKNGATDLIEFLGAVPTRDQLFKSAAIADVGVSFVPKISHDINMLNMVGASNKAFDYMAVGLPLLVTDLPEWISTFVTPGYGRACDPGDVDSLEIELRWYLQNPIARRQMGQNCLDKIRLDWNYEAMFAKVLAQVENG